MAKVILITTRHIEKALSGLKADSIRKQRNYHSVFFRISDDDKSAISDYVMCNQLFVNRIDGNKKGNELAFELFEALPEKSDEDVRELFYQLFFEEYLTSEDGRRCLKGNLTLLKHPIDTDDIEAVKKGIQRIRETNIFICHEWFSDRVSGGDKVLVEKTRIAYLKAILEDIKSEFKEQSIEEWFLIVHDADIATSIVADAERDIYPDPATQIVSARGHKDKLVTLRDEVYEELGVERDRVKIWIFTHADSVVYNTFVNGLPENLRLLTAPDSNIDEVVNAVIDI